MHSTGKTASVRQQAPESRKPPDKFIVSYVSTGKLQILFPLKAKYKEKLYFWELQCNSLMWGIMTTAVVGLPGIKLAGNFESTIHKAPRI